MANSSKPSTTQKDEGDDDREDQTSSTSSSSAAARPSRLTPIWNFVRRITGTSKSTGVPVGEGSSATNDVNYLESVRKRRYRLRPQKSHRPKFYRFSTFNSGRDVFVNPTSRQSNVVRRGRRPFAKDPETSYEPNSEDEEDLALDIEHRIALGYAQREGTRMARVFVLKMIVVTHQIQFVVEATDEEFGFAVLAFLILYLFRTRRTPIPATPAEGLYGFL